MEPMQVDEPTPKGPCEPVAQLGALWTDGSSGQDIAMENEQPIPQVDLVRVTLSVQTSLTSRTALTMKGPAQ